MPYIEALSAYECLDFANKGLGEGELDLDMRYAKYLAEYNLQALPGEERKVCDEHMRLQDAERQERAAASSTSKRKRLRWYDEGYRKFSYVSCLPEVHNMTVLRYSC